MFCNNNNGIDINNNSLINYNWKQNLIASGIARFIVISSLYPIDTIKTQKQLKKNIKFNFSLFKGINIALLGQLPYTIFVFSSYELFKNKILFLNPNINNYYYTKIPLLICSACIADSIGAIWLTPYEILKQLIQSGKITNPSIKIIYYKNLFYSNYFTLLYRDIPFRAIQLPLYEILRDFYISKYYNIYPHETMILGASVGMIAAAITTPFDIIKSRKMVGYKENITLVNIIKKEGYSSLFTGIKQRVSYLGLANGLFFIIFEFIKKSLNEKAIINI
tara:strand:- start:2913 stop:3746 length:834 start_codon:yes stop_codon:yes gene_type:complete